MGVNLNDFEIKLAENKVYDAWTYVKSLRESLCYMNMSYNLLKKVSQYRNECLNQMAQDKFSEASDGGTVKLRKSDLNVSNLNIGGYTVDDAIFLKKTTLDFFHYGRISMEVLFQIINCALLGDRSIQVNRGTLSTMLTVELERITQFSNLVELLKNNKVNSDYNYLTAFDNYVKHIKIIPITITNNIFFGDTNIFKLNKFYINNVSYVEEEAIEKIEGLQTYIINTIEEILEEVFIQIPNCINNSQRIQDVSYLIVYDKFNKDENIIKYFTFFIEVDSDLLEIPREIKVLPLKINANGKVFSSDFQFDKIFIKKRGGDETSIIGFAQLKNGLNTNEIYRIYEVNSCGVMDYYNYKRDFLNTYAPCNTQFNAMEGKIIVPKKQL